MVETVKKKASPNLRSPKFTSERAIVFQKQQAPLPLNQILDKLFLVVKPICAK
jgi:hypothetical protein